VLDDGYLDWDMIAPRIDELAHVTNLQVYLGVNDYDHLSRARGILARTPALRGLDLELANSDFLDDGDCCNGAIWLITNMFRSRNEVWQPVRLKSLRITSMCLLRVGRHLPEVLELNMLEHLQLVRCTDVNPFLQCLEPLGLNLSTLCIKDSDGTNTTDFATDDFLRSLKALKSLTSRFSDVENFDERTFLSHNSSLEFLGIEDILWAQAVLPPSKNEGSVERLFVTVSVESCDFTFVFFPIFH